MKFIKIILIISLLCPAFSAFSQRVALHQTNVDRLYDVPKEGENRKRHSWVRLSLLGTDIAFGDTDSKQDFSNYFGLSFNRKHKLNNILSHGYGVGIHRHAYRLSEEGLQKAAPELTLTADKGKLIFSGVNVNYFVRFNFDYKRGNIVGTYLDFGVFGQNDFFWRAVFEEEGSLIEKNRGKNFSERYAYGVETRLGRNATSLYARYRLSEHNSKSNVFANMDLAKLSIGLNIDF